MPKSRRLSGQEVIKILQQFEFVVVKITGSHHKLRRFVDGEKQTISVPVHGNKELSPATLNSIYRAACRYIGEDVLRPYFYTE
jgi:predicted RNA binding protein YcfA (HicA-like mRNA interferase family)